MDIAPTVFEVPDGEDCVIRPGAADHFQSKRDDILLAAADCPVEVIAIEATTAATQAAGDQPQDDGLPADTEIPE